MMTWWIGADGCRVDFRFATPVQREGCTFWKIRFFTGQWADVTTLTSLADLKS